MAFKFCITQAAIPLVDESALVLRSARSHDAATEATAVSSGGGDGGGGGGGPIQVSLLAGRLFSRRHERRARYSLRGGRAIKVAAARRTLKGGLSQRVKPSARSAAGNR